MGFFHQDIAVDTVVDLQNLAANTNPSRVDDGLYYVRELDLWYRYDVSGTPSGADITPTDTIGAFKVGASGSGGGGSLISGTINPIGNVTPSSVGDIYLWEPVPSSVDGEKIVYFRSTGTNNTDWEAWGGTPVMWFDNALALGSTADFIGQLAFEISTGSGAGSVDARYVATQIGTGGDDWAEIF